MKSLHWIIDAQLPPALATLLLECGHQAKHVESIGMRHSSDTEIWDYALKNKSVVVTKDEDFQSRALVDKQAPAIVWLRIGNCSRQALLNWFKPLLPDIEKRLKNGETIIEIR